MDETKKIKDKELEKEMVSSMASFNGMTTKIAEFLYHYTIKTGIHFGKERPRILGNVAYWLEQKNAQTILMYNIHPKDWNINRITFDLDNAERQFFEMLNSGNSNSGPTYL